MTEFAGCYDTSIACVGGVGVDAGVFLSRMFMEAYHLRIPQWSWTGGNVTLD